MIKMTLKNGALSGGKRQLARSLTLSKQETEILMEKIKELHPQLQEFLNALAEVSRK